MAWQATWLGQSPGSEPISSNASPQHIHTCKGHTLRLSAQKP